MHGGARQNPENIGAVFTVNLLFNSFIGTSCFLMRQLFFFFPRWVLPLDHYLPGTSNGKTF